MADDDPVELQEVVGRWSLKLKWLPLVYRSEHQNENETHLFISTAAVLFSAFSFSGSAAAAVSVFIRLD